MRLRALPTTWMLMAGFALAAAPAIAQESGADRAQAQPRPVDAAGSGGAEYGKTTGRRASTAARPIVSGTRARLMKNGRAAAPSMAPAEVQKAIWAANRIVRKPYLWGGGHARWWDKGYDCSGTISWALRGGKRSWLKAPLNSTGFQTWGAKGPGRWITVYTNPGHAYVVIAGLRLDTSAAGDPSGEKGPRWRPNLRETSGYTVRHPAGF